MVDDSAWIFFLQVMDAMPFSTPDANSVVGVGACETNFGNGHFPFKNGHFPFKNGHFPFTNGHFPFTNGHFPFKHGKDKP